MSMNYRRPCEELHEEVGLWGKTSQVNTHVASNYIVYYMVCFFCCIYPSPCLAKFLEASSNTHRLPGGFPVRLRCLQSRRRVPKRRLHGMAWSHTQVLAHPRHPPNSPGSGDIPSYCHVQCFQSFDGTGTPRCLRQMRGPYSKPPKILGTPGTVPLTFETTCIVISHVKA